MVEGNHYINPNHPAVLKFVDRLVTPTANQLDEERLDDLAELVESQSQNLRGEIRSIKDDFNATETRLENRLTEAAGGLTLESWGVFLFIIGVVLTTWGGVIA